MKMITTIGSLFSKVMKLHSLREGLCVSLALLTSMVAWADNKTVSSPDGRLQVTISCQDGHAAYSVSYDGREVVRPSALGLKTNLGDFTHGLSMQEKTSQMPIDTRYKLTRSKCSDVHYQSNRLQVDFLTEKKIPMSIIFQVSNNDVAFCYRLGRGPKDNPKCAVVESEATSFNLPDGTTTFICPQITPMTVVRLPAKLLATDVSIRASSLLKAK